FWQNFANDFFDDETANLGVLDVLRVLRGNDDAGNADRFAVFVNHRDLRFGVRPQPRNFATLAYARELAAEAMGKHDRRGHELGRFVARITEHQALVAGALFGCFLSFRAARIDALGDVGGLAGDNVLNVDFVGMKNVVVIDVTDSADAFAHDFRNGHGGFERAVLRQIRNGDFTAHDHG